MNATRLHRLLQDILRASLSAPLLLGSISCGGQTSSLPASTHDGDASPPADGASGQDSAPLDSSVPKDASQDSTTGDATGSCTGQACGVGGCGAPCGVIETCVNGMLQCSCSCPPPVDAGPCHPSGCGTVALPAMCLDGITPGDGGTLTTAQCTQLCGGPWSCTFDVATDSIECSVGCPAGRRPAGMRAARACPGASATGRYFARMAHLEAASVDAFRILRAELLALGAPASLVRDAARAQRDEVRHARLTRALARRHGAPSPARRVRGQRRAQRRAARSLEAIAIENVVEGCVRETFGALLAVAQATSSEDPQVRAAMHSIAPDETRHAALAWAVAAWSRRLLDADALARVDDARDAAIESLLREVDAEPPSQLRRLAGLPTAAMTRRMVGGMKRSLWARL